MRKVDTLCSHFDRGEEPDRLDEVCDSASDVGDALT